MDSPDASAGKPRCQVAAILLFDWYSIGSICPNQETHLRIAPFWFQGGQRGAHEIDGLGVIETASSTELLLPSLEVDS